MSLDITLLDPTATYRSPLYDCNVTHNLNVMANKAGIYEALWRPEEINAELAEDISPIVEEGLNKMKEDPDHFRQFDSSNGWGTYDGFITFLEELLEALKEYPLAKLGVCR
jgi:hypothetical protein